MKPNRAEESVQEILTAPNEPFRYMSERILILEGKDGLIALANELVSEDKTHTPEQVARLEGTLATIIEENNFGEAPELIAVLPAYFDRVLSSQRKPSEERHRLLQQISKPTMGLLAEKLGSLEGETRRHCLRILAFMSSTHPEAPEARKLIPIFTEEAVAGYSVNFADALVMMGAEGVDALLEKAESAGETGRENILKELVITNTNNIAARLLFPNQGKLVRWTSEIACLEGNAEFARAVITRLSDIGLPAAEPLILLLNKKGLAEDTHNRCLSVLSNIAEKNHNAPVLAAAVPFFLEKRDWRTVVNIGIPAIPALLKAFDKNPADAAKIEDVIRKIADGVEKIDNGVVATPVKPPGLDNVFMSRALDLNLNGMARPEPRRC